MVGFLGAHGRLLWNAHNTEGSNSSRRCLAAMTIYSWKWTSPVPCNLCYSLKNFVVFMQKCVTINLIECIIGR